MQKIAIVIFALCCALLPAQAAFSAPQADNEVVRWNQTLLEILRTPGAHPPTVHPTRSFALMHAAIYDAVNAIDRTHRPYMVEIPGLAQQASQQAAATTAAHRVLLQLYPKSQAMLDAQSGELLALIPDATAKRLGIQIGNTVADQIVARRSNDGSNAQPIPYSPGPNPGDYQHTPPNFPQPGFTHWAHVTPFTLIRADQFRPGHPPKLTGRKYTAAFQEVKELGAIGSTTRSAEQTQIGRFWNAPIQNYWNEIAQTTALAQHLSLAQSARLFALLNLTLADSVIAFYDAKYTYAFWRPVSAIRLAESDGNPDTTADPGWLPLTTNTAPDPSYPGAHSVISAAAAAVLRDFFDSDDVSFAVHSELLPGVERSFSSFSAAAEEAGLSRIYAGVHFRFDHTSGRRLGRDIAEYVFDDFLVARRQRERESNSR